MTNLNVSSKLVLHITNLVIYPKNPLKILQPRGRARAILSRGLHDVRLDGQNDPLGMSCEVQ